MRVSELAKALNMSSTELLPKLKQLRIVAKSAASTLDADAVNRARKALAKPVKKPAPAKPAMKAAPIKRAAAAPLDPLSTSCPRQGGSRQAHRPLDANPLARAA